MKIEKEWLGVDNPPKDQYLVEVKDEFGNTGYAEATYYPFTVEYRPGKWKSKVHPCDPYHDGGWLILADKGLDSEIKGKIKFWREINQQ